MKITSFGPLVVSPKAEELIRLFEELGFEKQHIKSDIEGGQNINSVMMDSDGNRIDVASTEHLERDLMSIRINVDDFDEAYRFFLDHGFINTRGDKITETSSSKDTFLISPSGFGITLTEHLK